MRDQVPGLLRLRRRRLFLRVRAPTSAADRGCCRSADPGQRRSRLASWARRGAARRRCRPVAWLAVDETDNDLQAFWLDVLGALTIGDAVPADSPLRSMMPAAG